MSQEVVYLTITCHQAWVYSTAVLRDHMSCSVILMRFDVAVEEIQAVEFSTPSIRE